MEKILDTVERVGNKVPHPAVTFILLILAVIVLSHLMSCALSESCQSIAADAGYLVLIPLGAAAILRVGNPLAGLNTSFAAVSSVFSANIIVKPVHGILQGITNDAIHRLNPNQTNLYTKQCALNPSAGDLAVMGARLADGGVNPLSKKRRVDPEVCHSSLAVMATAGLYQTSGDGLYDVGVPGKSGIGGGIVAFSPGKGAFGTFAPLLDNEGNSVKGQLVAKFLRSNSEWTCSHRNPNSRHNLKANCSRRAGRGG